ncbi:MAG: phenylalanine--tRNA ligase subunit alpha [Thermoplasmata archaeon]
MAEETGEAPEGGAPIILSGPERAVLKILRAESENPWDEAEIAARASLPPDTVRGSLQRLKSKRLVVVEEESTEQSRLTTRGKDVLTRGLPERRLLRAILEHGGALSPDGVAQLGLNEEERSAAIGILRRRNLLEDGVPFRLRSSTGTPEDLWPEELVLKQVANEEEDVDAAIFQALQRRGLVEIERHTIRHWSASEEGRRLPMADSEESLLGALTSSLLASDGWKHATFRPYDVRADVPYLSGARPHPYQAWLEEFEEILIGLGFEESEGPLLETEFWNADALFMPQDHPARSIHDALSVQGIQGQPPPADVLGRVAAVHEGRPLPGETNSITPGWGSPYDVAIAARPVLRSQTTAVSARYLARHPKPPFRMYALDRNFRREALDATHHIEFGQCEGVIGEEGITLRELVGIFRDLAEAIGIRELKIRPSYFPFTEPSIEGYVRHPRLGWIEIFPGGLLRPEVRRPLGIDVPVAAWGIGITRLAMIALGANDIRDLYQDDLATLRGERR